jgi:hypothetical protein
MNNILARQLNKIDNRILFYENFKPLHLKALENLGENPLRVFTSSEILHLNNGILNKIKIKDLNIIQYLKQ